MIQNMLRYDTRNSEATIYRDERNHGRERCNNYVISWDTTERKNASFISTYPQKYSSIRYINSSRSIASLFLALLLAVAGFRLSNCTSPDLGLPISNDNEAPDECEACKLVVVSFEKGMEKTMRGQHEGGDTSWEERNLKSYADSEVRLVEIQEDLCHDTTKGKSQCFSLAEDAEAHIEDWWFNHRRNNIRLHDYLCINKLKKCCPEGAYGPTCKQCQSCNNHGTCDGAGTRSGTGECLCQLGYTGDQCEECQQNYYKIQTTNANSEEQNLEFSCLECHGSCANGCSGPSSANCTECKPGYHRDPITKRCIDINECELNSHGLSVGAKKLCPDGTYCQNTEGHYKCASCHRACSTCLAFGRNKCMSCATDHFMDEEHNCVYTRDYHRHDPNIRDDENFLAYVWRRFQTDIVLQITLNILLYPIVRRIVEQMNYGDPLTRKLITLLATVNLQMELAPFVNKMIITNFGRNVSNADSSADEASDGDLVFDYPPDDREL